MYEKIRNYLFKYDKICKIQNHNNSLLPGQGMKLRGRIIKKLLYAGTKSEHEGIVLVTSDGGFKLRRKGGNPFHDEVIEKLEGKEIEGKGILRGDLFIMDHWRII